MFEDWRPLRWWWQRQWLNLLLPSKISPWWKDFHPELASWTSRHNVRRNNSYRNLYLSNMIIWKPCTSVFYISLGIWTHKSKCQFKQRSSGWANIGWTWQWKWGMAFASRSPWWSTTVDNDDLQRWMMMNWIFDDVTIRNFKCPSTLGRDHELEVLDGDKSTSCSWLSSAVFPRLPELLITCNGVRDSQSNRSETGHFCSFLIP